MQKCSINYIDNIAPPRYDLLGWLQKIRESVQKTL